MLKTSSPATLTSFIVWTVNLLEQEFTQKFSLIFGPGSCLSSQYTMMVIPFYITWTKKQNIAPSPENGWSSLNHLWYFKFPTSFIQWFRFRYCENYSENRQLSFTKRLFSCRLPFLSPEKVKVKWCSLSLVACTVIRSKWRVLENSASIAFVRSKLHLKEVILAQGYIRSQ